MKWELLDVLAGLATYRFTVVTSSSRRERVTRTRLPGSW